MNVLDIFSGIGGFSLGLERAGGFRTVAFCECEPYCRAVLKKHWPDIPCYADVAALNADRLASDGIRVDVIAGGFPCQDISLAGKGEGLAGARSGLWSEYRRLIEELRPQWAIIENVSALRSRGLETVLGQLSALGYDAEWHCIPASAVGAPHQRDRVWIIAHPRSQQYEGGSAENERPTSSGFPQAVMAHAAGDGLEEQRIPAERQQLVADPIGRGWRGSHSYVADANSEPGNERRACNATQKQGGRNIDRGSERTDFCNANSERLEVGEGERQNHAEEFPATFGTDWWAVEPDVGRVANGIPRRVDRLRCLGNAVVPQVVEEIGRAIMKAHLSDTERATP